uniref:Uncharacterized protein n=1 Tax=Meloidogyne enterolobii TaxID=390850 RepID=A0A6V7UGR2_MELEN|nr:unnamed protein product [Meloidogyne enterolobii]
MNSQSLIIFPILLALVMLFTVQAEESESKLKMKDDVELETHHLQDTHHMEKRQCFCGPLRVPCSCAGRKSVLLTLMLSSLLLIIWKNVNASVFRVPYLIAIHVVLDVKGALQTWKGRLIIWKNVNACAVQCVFLVPVLDVKKRSANTGMKDAVDLEIHRLKKGQCDCVRSPLRIPNPCCRLLKKRGVNTELIDNAQHEVHQLENVNALADHGVYLVNALDVNRVVL